MWPMLYSAGFPGKELGHCHVERGSEQGGDVDRLNHHLDHHDHHHNFEDSGQPDQCLHHRARSR